MKDLDYKYWLVFYKDDEKSNVYHIIGVDEIPSLDELEAYREEVRYDGEFGLGDFVDTLSIKIVPDSPEMRKYLENILKWDVEK